jgi:hypothetical protein
LTISFQIKSLFRLYLLNWRQYFTLRELNSQKIKQENSTFYQV